MNKFVAEFLGTFCMVFAGTGAIIINDVSGGVITHVGISLVFGLVVLAMIYTIGDISGAHINPAVTVGFFLARRMPGRLVAPFVLSQFAGAILASSLLWLSFPDHHNLGATLPQGPVSQSLVFEIILTFILMFVILNVSTGSKEKGAMAGIAVGSVIALGAMFAGPISGASMNPARSVAPALLSGHLDYVWVYLLAPVLGAGLAVPLCLCVRKEGCCTDSQG